MKIPAYRAFANEQLHPLGELFFCLRKVCDLVVGAHAGA